MANWTMCKNNTILPKNAQIRNSFSAGTNVGPVFVKGFPLGYSLTIVPGHLSCPHCLTLS